MTTTQTITEIDPTKEEASSIRGDAHFVIKDAGAIRLADELAAAIKVEQNAGDARRLIERTLVQNLNPHPDLGDFLYQVGPHKIQVSTRYGHALIGNQVRKFLVHDVIFFGGNQ